MCTTLQCQFDEFNKASPKKKDFADRVKSTKYKSISVMLYLLWDNSYLSIQDYLALCEEKLFYRIWREYFEEGNEK